MTIRATQTSIRVNLPCCGWNRRCGGSIHEAGFFGPPNRVRMATQCPKLPGAECHRRHGHVRPEDVVENQDHELGVLKLQMCRLLPVRLKISDRLLRLARP